MFQAQDRALRHPLSWGGAGFIAVIVLAVTAWHPAKLQRDQLREVVVHTINTAAKHVRSDVSDPSVVFYEQFPSRSVAAESLMRLELPIQEHGLLRERTKYLDTPISDTPLISRDIEMALRGPYPEVRTFLARALSEIPHMALIEASFTRSQLSDSQVEGLVRLRLHLRQ